MKLFYRNQNSDKAYGFSFEKMGNIFGVGTQQVITIYFYKWYRVIFWLQK